MVDPRKIGGRFGNQLFQLAYLYAQAREGKISDIFVQDFHYFEKYEKEIKELFGEGIGYLPYVGIHLRVGGNPINSNEPKYMDNPYYTSLVKTGFFIKALEYFPNDKFIVFSDDQKFARTYFEGSKFSFDESENDIDSFNKMASCHSQIISNSSFSYWAGFLNKNVSKKVVCPSETSWYADGVVRIKVPKDWIQIEP